VPSGIGATEISFMARKSDRTLQTITLMISVYAPFHNDNMGEGVEVIK